MESAQSLVLRFLISAAAERRTVATDELLSHTLQSILAIFLRYALARRHGQVSIYLGNETSDSSICMIR